ncbi:uncharacterized protein LOC110848543 [Folsomia candida]|uniref:uncharacterized protein LOC110848543 n=1 Tax=Folsomia candida TaxID=158441 RepID=UPI001604D129|nr:uncharacterized protein LOC110848543 [Folsomia candida]
MLPQVQARLDDTAAAVWVDCVVVGHSPATFVAEITTTALRIDVLYLIIGKNNCWTNGDVGFHAKGNGSPKALNLRLVKRMIYCKLKFVLNVTRPLKIMKATFTLLMAMLLVSCICHASHESEKDRRAIVSQFDQIRIYESETDCLCPAGLNTKGTYFFFCGRDLTPADKCAPEGVMRCVNGRTKAILIKDCTTLGAKCRQQTILKSGKHCPHCEAHGTKDCMI